MVILLLNMIEALSREFNLLLKSLKNKVKHMGIQNLEKLQDLLHGEETTCYTMTNYKLSNDYLIVFCEKLDEFEHPRLDNIKIARVWCNVMDKMGKSICQHWRVIGFFPKFDSRYFSNLEESIHFFKSKVDLWSDDKKKFVVDASVLDSLFYLNLNEEGFMSDELVTEIHNALGINLF